MAAVEPVGGADPLESAQWLVIRGTLREADLAMLLEDSTGDDRSDVTLDLFDAENLTPGGCWAIRRLADELWSRRRRLTVMFQLGGRVADALRSSGTIQHPRAVFHGTHRE